MKAPSSKRATRSADPAPNPTEAATYIAEMCRGLGEIAENAGLSMVAYFLKLAELEGETVAHLAVDPEPGRRDET